LGSRRSRISPKPLPRIYIKKESLEHEEEESFVELCCPIAEKIFLFTTATIRLPSLIKKLRRARRKEKRGMHLH
jgi:hypothetical protein